jgi:hypothetical protein
MSYEFDFLGSLFLTVAIETIVLLLLNKTSLLIEKQKFWIILITGITASCATLPYFWFILPLFIRSKLAYSIVAEFLAVFLESFIVMGLLRINYKIAFAVSLLCNLISYSLGLLISLI